MRLEDNLNDTKKISEILDLAPVTTDIITSLCGKHLGSGTFRTVFEYNLDSNYVIKLEPLNTSCNMIEYMIWEEVSWLQGDKEWVKKWFAPVKWISPNGRVLIMKKTKDSAKNSKTKRPDKIPAFLWDVKETNFGWIGNDYVCHDYGQFYNMIHYPKKMAKVNWETAGY